MTVSVGTEIPTGHTLSMKVNERRKRPRNQLCSTKVSTFPDINTLWLPIVLSGSFLSSINANN